MKEDLERIIEQLEKAQDLLNDARYAEAKTAIYEAQNAVRFVKDNKA